MLVSTEGDHIKISASKYPFPTVCAHSQSVDLFHSISRTLKWNERERQKSFVVVEEGPAKKDKKRRPSEVSENGVTVNGNRAEGEEDEEEDEEAGEDEDDDDEDVSNLLLDDLRIMLN